MKKHSAATTGDARPGVVIDLDDEIIEVIVTHQPVAAIPWGPFDGPVVVPVRWIFRPGIGGPDRPGG